MSLQKVEINTTNNLLIYTSLIQYTKHILAYKHTHETNILIASIYNEWNSYLSA